MHYLLIDMPPGTADIQMGLARMMPRTEVVIVTTPALAAQQVAARAADMARKGYLRVAGVVENMSASVAPDGTRYAVFGSGGGERLAEQLGVPLLGSIPLDPAVGAGGDAGEPAAIATPHTPAAQAFAAWPSASSPRPSRSSRWSPAPPDSSSKPPVSSTPCRSHRPTAATRTRHIDNNKEPFRMSTIEVTTTPVINLTDRAAAKVAELIAQEGDGQLALRVAVKAGGCSGMSYEIFFDADTEPEDHEVVFGTVKVRVDPASAPHLAGATLDYKDGLKDAGFHIENPNAKRSCGCGQSFS